MAYPRDLSNLLGGGHPAEYVVYMTLRTHVGRPESGGVVVFVEGEFEASDAASLLSVTGGVAGGGPISVDFHDARVVDSTALCKVAREFSGSARQIKLDGLSERQHRLLRYIGLEREHHRSLDADIEGVDELARPAISHPNRASSSDPKSVSSETGAP